MAIGESAGILFRIRGDESDAVRALNHTQRETAQLTGATTTLGTSFSSMGATAAIAGAAIVGVGIAAVAGVKALYNLAQTASEFGSAIFDATQKTGLGAETMSALKIAAEQSGSSFEGVTNAVSKFNVLIGQAAAGNEKATKILAQYGITAKDTGGALAQAVEKIASMKSASDQAAAAAALFKDRTGEILPVIKSFDGDLPGLINKLRDLGVLMSDEDARAADAFGDQMALLNEQLAGVARTIGIEFMPMFRTMARDVSGWLTRNKGEIKDWAAATSDSISAVVSLFSKLIAKIKEYGELLPSLPQGGVFLPGIGAFLVEKAQAEARRKGQAVPGAIDYSRPQDRKAAPGDDDSAERNKASERARERARDLAARLAERDLVAQIRIESGNLKTIQEQARDIYEEQRKKLGEGSNSIASFIKLTNDNTALWRDNLMRSLAFIEELERAALKADTTEHERALLAQQQTERRQQIEKTGAAELKKNEDTLHEARKKRWEEELEAGERKAEQAQQHFEEEMERLEQRQAALDAMLPGISSAIPQLSPEAPSEAYDPFQSWIDSWTRFVDQIYADAPTLKQTFQSIGGIITSAFSGMANAIGNVVQGWVLYGETGPAVMRKVLAAALASIAAEAAVRAIWELALGFASLFFNPAEAVAHFTAAALFGTIAGVAAIAGRAVAGNAFRQQTSTATGQTGSNTQGSRASAGAYSGQEPETREMGINRAQPSEVHIKLGIDPDGVIQFLSQDVKNNGRFRFLVLDTVGNA